MIMRRVRVVAIVLGVAGGLHAGSLPINCGSRAWAQQAPAPKPLATENTSRDQRDPKAGEVHVPRTIDEAVESLASGQWSVRDAAQRWLLRQPAVARSDVEQKIDETADPEVTARLEEVALHLYLKSLTSLHGKAAMLGISLGLEPVRLGTKGDDVRMAVVVMELQPGFPSAEVLRIGDRIVGLAGHPFGLDMTVENFRSVINALEPGDTVELMVVRGKDELKMPVTLAGVPEGGIAAMSNYMHDRQARGAMYTQMLVQKIAKRDPDQGHRGLMFKVPPAPLEEDPVIQGWPGIPQEGLK